MRLVISMAGKFRHFGLPLGDLIQEGHVGLLEAAARFEPEREVRFSTYATWWIRASIQDYILRNWSIVRGGTSSAQKALFFNLRRLRARLAQGPETLSSASIYQEISSALGVSVSRRRDDGFAPFGARHVAQRTAGRRWHGSSDRHGFPGLRRSAARRGGGGDDRRRAPHRVAAATRSACSTQRELKIIRERRLQDDGATLESLGETMGISKERVRQIESRAMEKLKSALVKANPAFVSQSA